MQSSSFAYKLFFAEGGTPIALEDFVPIFHGWIRERRIDDVLIDVADYAHVADGPGVLLVCHEGQYVIDGRDARPGLSYARKRGDAGADLVVRATTPLVRALRAARLLAHDPALASRLSFRTDEIEVRVIDRLHGPNDDATLDAMAPGLSEAIARIWGAAPAELVRTSADPRSPLSIRASMPGAPGLDDLRLP
jgi:hypothetical protein